MAFLKNSKKIIKCIIYIFIPIGVIIGIIAISYQDQIANPVINDNIEVVTADHYSSYLSNYEGALDQFEEEYNFPATAFSLEPDEYLTDDIYHWINDASISLTLDIENEGLYLIYFNYQSLTDSHFPIGLSVKINGEIPYYEASQITLDTLWKESSEVGTDRYGNDVSVLQTVYDKWQNVELKDSTRLYNEGLKFYFVKGLNTIEISKISGELLLKDISVKGEKSYITYLEYLEKYPKNNNNYNKRLEAEEMKYNNSSTISRGTIRDVGVLPFSISKLKLNVIGTDSYYNPGDKVTWTADVKEAGYYYLTFKVNQRRQYSTSYRTLYINGEIPFLEAKHIPFSYSRKWQNVTLGNLNHEPFLIYLEPNDEISLEVDSTLFVNISEKLRMITKEMTELGLNVTKLTRNNIDKNIDWDMLEYFPNLIETLTRWIDDLNLINNSLRDLYGFNNDSQLNEDIDAAISKIEKIKSNINELPRRLTLLSTGSSSAAQLLAAQLDNVILQPLIVDAIYIHTESTLPKANASFWAKTKVSIARFFSSFFNSSYSEKASVDELEVWVNRSRQYVDLIQKVTDDVFTKEYGIKVKISIMSDDGKLILANSANKQPDVALGVSAWIPNEYGMRGMLYDITQFEGFEDTIDNYNSEQLVPMIYNQKLYGLPETENFYVLLYRKDILDKLDLEVPNTWNDVLEMLPILERYGMTFYVPLSNSSSAKSFDTTAPFIFQFGGKLYSDDGLKAEVDDEATIAALTFMTDLYREYSLPTQVPSFYNSFRYGSIPIGIADFGTYLQLINSASEIRGLWDIALVPGVEHSFVNPDTNQEETIINRSMPGAQQAAIIFNASDKKEQAWEFLRWWTATETQVLFSENLINTLGTRYIWNSANIEAFKESRIKESHKNVILGQWEHLREVPKIPGSYIVEREISNTWNSVVFNNANIRSTITDAMLKMNKEIARKMKEFGYLDSQGNQIKPFIIPSSEDVRRWVEDEND